MPAPVRLSLSREEPGDGGEPASESVIGAEAFPTRPPADGQPYRAAGPDAPVRDPAGRPGYVVFRLFPPEDGWPTGPGVLRVELDGFEADAVERPVRVARRLDPEVLIGGLFGVTPPPGPFAGRPANPPDRGFVLDVNDAAAKAEAEPDAPAATLRPWERFTVRGTFRGPAPPAGVGYGPTASAQFSWGRGFAFAGNARSFPEGEPDADGNVLYWYRLPVEIPDGAAGRYRLEIETGDGPRDWERTPPLTVLVEDEPDADAAPADE